MAETGIVFQIQRFCTNDGPGIRTTVFLKGCPLDCKWCHNPESKNKEPNIFINYVRCVNCGLCAQICPCHTIEKGVHVFRSENCTKCGKCINSCPVKAISFCGTEMTVPKTMEKVIADIGFYKHSGGGLTISGGEILAQADFAIELLKEAKKYGIHTCIETSGAAKFETLEKVASHADLVLYDVKETNDENHIKYIGVSNKLIQENLKKLNDNGHKIILRCPIIPGVNDRTEHFDKIVELYNNLENVENINILPYHDLGEGKVERYGFDISFDEFVTPDDKTVEEWNEYIDKRKTK